MIKHSFALSRNPGARRELSYGAAQSAIVNAQGLAAARAEITTWPGYEPTPLVALDGLAGALGIARIDYKDESQRFGLGSFKPLGGAYAVFRTLVSEIEQRSGQIDITGAVIRSGAFRDIVGQVTVCAATDGNHGRSVAWGARMFGCRCVIFIHETVTAGREQAIAQYGAHVVRTPGTFDDAVRIAQETAEREAWHVIPDTSDGKIVEAPRNVMQGYALMAAEAMAQLPYDGAPSHLFLQAGVGGLAAASCAQFWQAFSTKRPFTTVVEPENAACWYASLKAGEPISIEGDLESIMAGLACGEISRLAWPILAPGVDAMMTIPDTAAADVMRILADPPYADPPIVAGESAVAGLAGLLLVAGDEAARQQLGLGSDSRIVLFGSEGDTDSTTYKNIVGRCGDTVREAQRYYAAKHK